MKLSFTRFESTYPAMLSKRFALEADGKLTKVPVAQMIQGTARVVEVDSLPAFAAVLDGLTCAQAVGYGIPRGLKFARIVTSKALRAGGFGQDVIARTREHFEFRDRRQGILMLDHDEHPDGSLEPEQLHSMLIDAVPELAEAPMLWRASASSGILGPDGAAITGLKGQRLYVPVEDASRIPELGRAIVERLWAAGIGWCRPSRAGSILERTIVDASVWQSERLDFAGPPGLGPGLRREVPPARLFGPAGAPPLAAREILIDGARRKAASSHREAAKQVVRVEAEQVHEEWIRDRTPVLAKSRSITVDAAASVLRSAGKNVLMRDFLLTAEDGSQVSVGELLDDRARWHGTRFADPLEPEYQDDHRIAWVNLRSGSRPCIYSHAHGGQKYVLVRAVRRIRLAPGDRARVVDDVLEGLRVGGALYDQGSTLVRIADGCAVPVSPQWLLDHLDREFSFYSIKMTTNGPVEYAQDVLLEIANAVLAKTGERGLPRLTAVVSAPTLRVDGSVLDEPGYDPDSGLLYIAGLHAPRVPLEPTPQQALEALSILWKLVAQFPFVEDVDRGVMLQAFITASLRAVLPTAPGMAITAPMAGSGKTLLGKVIGILASGHSPEVLPPVTERDDETRKRLFAALLDGRRALLWDNVREPLGGAALDAFLTAPMFADRVLGRRKPRRW